MVTVGAWTKIAGLKFRGIEEEVDVIEGSRLGGPPRLQHCLLKECIKDREMFAMAMFLILRMTILCL